MSILFAAPQWRGSNSMEELAAKGKPAEADDPMQPEVVEGVAIIRIMGLMVKGRAFRPTSDPFVIARQTENAAADSKVKAIMLVADSPGGYTDGLADLEDAVKAAKQIKPVVAQVDGMAASGAYWAISQAHEIYAGRLDEVGSIGVYGVIDDASEYFEKEGIKTHVISTGEFKGAGVLGAPVTDNQLKDFQRIVNIYFDGFLSAIETGRGMTRKQVMEVADGRVFIGKEAVDNGLIDNIATFKETFVRLQGRIKEEADIQARRERMSRIELEYAKRKASLLEQKFKVSADDTAQRRRKPGNQEE